MYYENRFELYRNFDQTNLKIVNEIIKKFFYSNLSYLVCKSGSK